MTEVRLRKMLLAYAVSNSISDTVCAVETPKEEIISDFKEKNPSYKDVDMTVEQVMEEYEKKYYSENSKDVWSNKTLNYTLYYNSKKFFYFKDSDKKFGEDGEAWFLGAMGATTISTADGENLKAVTESGFEEIKVNFNAAISPLTSQAYKDMLSSYVKTGPDTIKMYTVNVSQKEYYFCFENGRSGKLEEPEQNEEGKIKYDIDADSVYDIGTQEINLTESIDLSAYSIPIELMMDLLNMTGSGEFLETFIDYALSQIDTSVTAYSLSTESKQYEQKKYNIDPDFVIEMYDIIDTVDDGKDNFKAYYDIIYNRKYNETDIPDNRVTSIDNYKEIRYKDGDNYNYENPNKDICKADYLHDYLKTAYEPVSDLGSIDVTEVICKTSSQNKWQLMVSSINTWYGNFTYTLTDPEVLYTIDGFDNATSDDYEAYNHTQMTIFNDVTEEEKEIIYIYKGLLNQVDYSVLDASKIANEQESDDIYDNAMKTASGKDNREHFQNWTMRGLAAIAQNDDGDKNKDLGAGQGVDYIYCKYKKINVKEATPVQKTAKQIINESNIQVTSSADDTEKKMKQFLALLRNKDGKIPDPLDSGEFTAKNEEPSIVVKYLDIYEGTIPAGDLLLDNGILMLNDLLEDSENTQELTNIFKYLAYLYTGVDYGITDVSELVNLFSFPSYIAQSSSGFWWPIGSEEITKEDGKYFAKGNPANSKITSSFGPRDPIETETGTTPSFHSGIDIAGDNIYGKPVIAVADGTVIESKMRTDGFGYTVKIEHSNGTITRYSHMQDDKRVVTEGENVKQGQVIGYVGSTGNSTGPHLDFGVYDAGGNAVNPVDGYVSLTNPRPAEIIDSPEYTFAGRNQSYYSLTDEQVRLFTAVIIGEGGTDPESVFWTASAMFNRIDARYYGDTDAMKILTRGWSEVYNKGLYKTRYSQITAEISQIVEEVINGKRAHKYIDFACDAPGYPMASNWIKEHPGEKYTWFKGNMYCDWREGLN